MNEEMERAGWQRSAISGGAHLKRIVEMYEELDFEVQLEEISPEECGQCTVCYVAGGEKIYRVYTRPKHEAGT